MTTHLKNVKRICAQLVGCALRRVVIICAVTVVCVAGPINTAVAQQDQWVGDVPIMKGLAVEPELGFAFDSPSGRVVMIFLSTESDSEDLYKFYDSALGNLGWSGGRGEWERGSETLSLEQVQTAVGTLWRIMVRPG